MGIYLPNMEMPKGCAFCKLKRRNGKKMVCPLLNEEWDIRDPMSAYFKLENCPLVPVPAHGRLIEAEPIMKYITDRLNSGEFGYDQIEVLTEIQYAPTIIPAEEGE